MKKNTTKLEGEKIEDYDSSIEPKFWEENGEPLNTRTLEEILAKYLGPKKEEKKEKKESEDDFTKDVLTKLNISITVGR